MTEHVCVWFFPDFDNSAYAHCMKCPATLDPREIAIRLNENETLKADKRLLMHVVHGRAMASSLPKHLKEE